jgi:hypothetical protein
MTRGFGLTGILHTDRSELIPIGVSGVLAEPNCARVLNTEGENGFQRRRGRCRISSENSPSRQERAVIRKLRMNLPRKNEQRIPEYIDR